MKGSRLLNLALACLLCLPLLAPTDSAAAPSQTLAGYEAIGGYATTSGLTFYYNPRYITDASTPGPEVAFYQRSGMSRLFLGIHRCNGIGDGPIYEQVMNTWQPVSYVATEIEFCLLTYTTTVPGNFTGDLAWD